MYVCVRVCVCECVCTPLTLLSNNNNGTYCGGSVGYALRPSYMHAHTYKHTHPDINLVRTFISIMSSASNPTNTK